MKRAIGETERRRGKQIEFNVRRGITPKGIVKQVRDMIEGVYDPQQVVLELKAAQEHARYETMSEKQLAREIRQLEKQMLEYARNLEFERAAQARDRLAELKRNFFGALPADEEGKRAVG
jgi:excinuclease ABC subunit B